MSASLVIAAPSSGQGKTLFTFGLLRALKNRGLDARPFKTGPDYIDPRFHEAASRYTCFNLDPWAMSAGRIASDIASSKANINIIEGVMGLFDGAQAFEDTSTAALAISLGAPVVLLVDCKGMAQSIAALVHGFKTWNPALKLAGVVLNRVASPKHEAMLRANLDVPVFGCLPAIEGLQLESRHLGLIQAHEIDGLDALCDRAATWVADHVDLDALVSTTSSTNTKTTNFKRIKPLGQRIAIARDTAFAFAYPHLLEDWRHAGADVSFFSPLANETPDPTTDAVFLPGGYPELYAGQLAANSTFLEGLREAAHRNAWIYGECGGFMALGEGLVDRDGMHHAMAGLLPLETSFENPGRQLGYRQITSLVDTPFGPAGSTFRGHEFHFSCIKNTADADLFKVTDASGNKAAIQGLKRGRVFGSWLHLIDSR